MPPSRRRNDSSILESSTVITANLIMATSSYVLSKITPRAPTTQSATPAGAAPATQARPPVMPALSVQPAGRGKKIVVQPDEGEDAKVDELAGEFIKRFLEKTQSETERMEKAPQPAVAASKWAGTVDGYHR